MKINNLLKWFSAITGVVLLLIGLVLKIGEAPANYDQFISGNSFVMLVIGIEAIIINFAFNHILDEDYTKQK